MSHEPTITLVSLNVEAVFTLGTRLARSSGLVVVWAFSVYMGRSLLSSVMLDWIVGHCRDVGTLSNPKAQPKVQPK